MRNIPLDIISGLKAGIEKRSIDLLVLFIITLFIPFFTVFSGMLYIKNDFSWRLFLEPPLIIITTIFLSCFIAKCLQCNYNKIDRKDLAAKAIKIPDNICLLSLVWAITAIYPNSGLSNNISYVIGAITLWYAYRLFTLMSYRQLNQQA